MRFASSEIPIHGIFMHSIVSNVIIPIIYWKNHVKKRDYQIAKELKERLSKVVRITDFRVFGSRARGIADKYSDMDIFIEVERLSRKIKEQITDIVWEVGFENYLVISPLVFSFKETRKPPMKLSPIVENIKEEGIRV